jgi:hypothetical protein
VRCGEGVGNKSGEVISKCGMGGGEVDLVYEGREEWGSLSERVYEAGPVNS